MTLPLLVPPLDPQTEPRLKDFMRVVALVLNGPLRQGQLLPGPPSGGGGISGLLYVGSGAPAASLGTTGCFYLDLTNGDLYQNQ